MILRAGKTFIRPLEISDAAEMLEVRIHNAEWLAAFEPLRTIDFLTLGAQEREVRRGLDDSAADRAYPFGIFATGDGHLIGRVALSNVVRGAWQNATLGYFVDRASNGLGHCTEAVGLVLRFAFESARLHRVQAAAMLTNAASARVLEKNGFLLEGISPNYLKINGRWEDHKVFAITAERWPAAPSW